MTPGSLRLAAPLSAATALTLLAAAAGGDLAGHAVRAMAVVALLGLGALALRRRRGAPASPAALSVIERHLIGKESGVAVVEAEGRRLVVGYGPAGVALLVELRGEERAP